MESGISISCWSAIMQAGVWSFRWKSNRENKIFPPLCDNFNFFLDPWWFFGASWSGFGGGPPAPWTAWPAFTRTKLHSTAAKVIKRIFNSKFTPRCELLPQNFCQICPEHKINFTGTVDYVILNGDQIWTPSYSPKCYVLASNRESVENSAWRWVTLMGEYMLWMKRMNQKG